MAVLSRSGSNPPSSGVLTPRCCCGPAGCRAAKSSACWGAPCCGRREKPATRPARRLRPGRPWLGRQEEADNEAGQPLAPGMLASHYAPRAPVRLNAERVEAGEALLAFGSNAIPG